MLHGSHIVIGFAAYAPLAAQGVLPVDVGMIAAVALGSLAPDLDHPQSRMGRILLPISYPLSKLFGHRTLTHSILALLGIGVLISQLEGVYQYATIGFGLGYALHLLADALTPSGIAFFYPVRIRLRIPFLRVQTGGVGELVLVGTIACLALTNVLWNTQWSTF